MKHSLKKILNERDLELSSILMTLETHVNSYVDLEINLPHLTDHSYHHYKAIENFLDQIIPDKIKMEFSPQEIFILLSSALFHDIGMVLSSEESISLNEVREKHAERSAFFIMKNAKEFSINPLLAKVISDICRAHRKPQHLISNIDEFVDYQGAVVKTRFLGALLSMADGFDILTQRGILSKVAGDISSTRWQANELIVGVHIDPESWEIVLRSIARQPGEIRIVLEVRDFLQKALSTIAPVLQSNGIFYSTVALDNQYEILSELSIKSSDREERIDQLSKEIDKKDSRLQLLEKENKHLREKVDEFTERMSIKSDTNVELEKLAEAAKSRSAVYSEDAERLRSRVSHLEKILIGAFVAAFASLLSLLVKFVLFGK